MILDSALNDLLLLIPKLEDRAVPSFVMDTKLKDATVHAIKELTLALYDDSRIYVVSKEAKDILNNILIQKRR